MEHYNTLMLINRLELPQDIINKIRLRYKYETMQKNYIKHFKELNKHLLYYCWLNKKLNKKDNINKSIISTIKDFDYYKKEKAEKLNNYRQN